MIPSVNFHLWEPCNMRCKFCFATFQDVKQSVLPKGHLPKDQAIQVVKELAEFGFEKITFAGGEPTLCPWITDLIRTAKESGMVTMIVTNGSNLSDEFLAANRSHLDWVAISIDSICAKTNIETGRAISGRTPLTCDDYKRIVDRVKEYGYGLKINTVVTKKNYNEDLSALILYAQPKRWKVLQVLPMKGQNDACIDSLTVSDAQFLEFIHNHSQLNHITNIVPESNHDMRGSYAMVDPAGRFFDNAAGVHNYSRPILEVGARIAIQQVDYDFNKFVKRGGIYNWDINRSVPSRITLSGQVASGKTTVGKILASRLQYRFISIGNRTREIAESKGLSIVEFQERCLANPDMDMQIDTQFSGECNSSEHLVIDYRLGFKFIQNAYHIYLDISDEEAIKRLKLANRRAETVETIDKRNESFKMQFLNSYGVDYTSPKHYNLIINVEQFSGPDEIVEYILSQIL